MSEESNLSDKIDELTFWVKFSVWTTFVNILKATLRGDLDKLTYELSDGERSTREIAQLLSRSGKRITHQTVSNMWQRWAAVPIVMPARKKGRFRRAVSLKSIGIEIPDYEGLPEEEGGTVDE